MNKPVIRILDRSTVLPDGQVPKLRDALQRYVDRYFGPAWRVDANIVLEHEGTAKPSDWELLFIDAPDIADALGFHDLSHTGTPMAKVFCEPTLEAGDTISGVASHEVAEILVDPYCQEYSLGPVQWHKPYGAQQFWATEVCDPVQAGSFNVLGMPMSDFVFPAWFSDQTPAGQRVSYLKTVTHPFQLDAGGWAIVCRGDRWKNVYGSKRAERQHHKRQHLRGSYYGDPSPWKKSRAER